MYPASFDHVAPTTPDDACSALGRFGDESDVLVGGQSLIPLMKLRAGASPGGWIQRPTRW